MVFSNTIQGFLIAEYEIILSSSKYNIIFSNKVQIDVIVQDFSLILD